MMISSGWYEPDRVLRGEERVGVHDLAVSLDTELAQSLERVLEPDLRRRSERSRRG